MKSYRVRKGKLRFIAPGLKDVGIRFEFEELPIANGRQLGKTAMRGIFHTLDEGDAVFSLGKHVERFGILHVQALTKLGIVWVPVVVLDDPPSLTGSDETDP